MGISDVIFDTLTTIIDECVDYYNRDEMMEILDHDGVLEVVASHLKVSNRLGYFRPTPEELASIEAHDWIAQAKTFIREYLEENYQNDD